MVLTKVYVTLSTFEYSDSVVMQNEINSPINRPQY